MRIEEIRRRFEHEWVLIEYSELDEELNVVEGEVVAHSPDKNEIYSKMRHFEGGNVAVEYIGEYPEELAVMF